jgi:hypothetical protein
VEDVDQSWKVEESPGLRKLKMMKSREKEAATMANLRILEPVPPKKKKWKSMMLQYLYPLQLHV